MQIQFGSWKIEYLYFQPQYLFVFVLHANKVQQHLYLVGVHDAEGLLELLDGGVGEGVENVGFLRHGGGCWVRRSTKYLQNNSALVKHAIYF